MAAKKNSTELAIMDSFKIANRYEGIDPELMAELQDELGDLELEVCLSGGYLSALFYEGELDGSDAALSLYLGGGGEYVDDLSLEMEIDGEKLTVTSNGDHGGKSGVFTDKTTVKGDPLKSLSLSSLTSELRYEPKKSSGNFSWKLSIPGAGSLDMSGSLTAQTDSISLNLDDIVFKVIGMDVCTLAFSYHVDNHVSWEGVENPRLITQMNQMELMMTALDIQSRAETWVEEMEELFTSRLPDELLYGMMY